MKSFYKLLIFNILAISIMNIFLSHSSVVADRDGLTFVTKKEFDTLTKNFNNQINQYNSSIDGKIDGAISDYLEGINKVKTEGYQIPHDWNYVYFMNEVVNPEFRLPEFDSLFSYTGYCVNTENCKQFLVSGRDKNEFIWSTTQTCKRPLFGLISGSESSIGDIYWRGIAERYHEKWDLTWTRIDKFSELQYIDTSSYAQYCGPVFGNAFLFNKSGYFSNVNTSTFFNPSLKYRYKTSSSGTATDVSYSTTDAFDLLMLPTVTLDSKDSKSIDFEHIIQYDKDAQWYMSNEKFNHSFFKHSLNPYKDTDLYNSRVSSLCKSGKEYIGACAATSKWYSGTSLTVSYTNGGETLTSIGMIGSKNASQIYQFANDKSINVNKKEFTIPKRTLESGFQLCASTKETEVCWDANFSEVYAYNGSTYVTNANEVDIYVSYEPFTNKTESSDLIKFTVAGVQKDFITTTNRKATLKWMQNKDSVIYIKCVPHFQETSYISNNWRIKLDLSGASKEFYVTTFR